MGNFDYISVSTTESAIKQLGSVPDRAKLLAGGTDLLDGSGASAGRPGQPANP